MVWICIHQCKSFILTAHSLFIGAREKVGRNFTGMETIQNVCANIWCNSNDVRPETRPVSTIVLGKEFVGFSEGQSKRKRRSATMCNTRGKFLHFFFQFLRPVGDLVTVWK